MLVNVSRFNSVQQSVQLLLHEELQTLGLALRHECSRSYERAMKSLYSELLFGKQTLSSRLRIGIVPTSINRHERLKRHWSICEPKSHLFTKTVETNPPM